MQISKSYSGTLPSVGSTSNRTYIFGVASTATVYQVKLDFINQTIADFLHDECGVDAAYEVRYGDTNKWLWMNGVPFLFVLRSNSSGVWLSVPYDTSAPTSNYSISVFSGKSSGIYSFSLLFAGNPRTGFSLRFKAYNSAAVAPTGFRFMKAKNVANGKDAMVFVYGNPSINTPGVGGNANGIDLNEDGTIDPASFSGVYISYLFSLYGKDVNKNSAKGKFPLVPMMAGIWQLTGIYCHIRGFGIPAAQSCTTEMQTEIEISGRRFLNTVAEAAGGSYINIGLIEVTGA